MVRASLICDALGSARPYRKFISLFARSGVVFWFGAQWPSFPNCLRQDSTMQRTFTFIFAVVLLGLTTAHAQTGIQLSDQTSVGSGTVASDPLSIPTSSLPSSQDGAGTSGSGSASSSSTDPEIPVLLPGEASNTSTQTASTTTSASGSSAGKAASSSSSCGPQVPSTDGGSVNLTEIAGGLSLGGC